jgi:hypothetical protein
MKRKLLFLVAAFPVLFTHCHSGRNNAEMLGELYGKNYDGERDKRGIIRLHPEMRLALDGDSTTLHWINTSNNDIRQRPGDDDKYMFFKNGKATIEKDIFNTHIPGFQMTLVTQYYYDTALFRHDHDTACCSPWYCTFKNDSIDQIITHAQADSLIDAWEVKKH